MMNSSFEASRGTEARLIFQNLKAFNSCFIKCYVRIKNDEYDAMFRKGLLQKWGTNLYF